ncbi:MAG: DUF1109 family protein [Rhodobacter sp.]|uniref:NrsF family protein n=1 Tax=Pararhodobacter sp. TaxID=2127056 RepID=UPI002CCC878A|nr:NrsF family protein [Pararhodobacter sp.]MCC0071690.1 DUF1109 family protein [Rhodobacter sp.]HPD93408.1 NrsF family protein [Pararhodobacter sp.]
MNTDELIAALSADGAPRITPEGRMWRALPGASLLALGALLLFWHTRPDLAQALGSFAVYKTAVPLVLAALALGLARGIGHPEARLRVGTGLLGLVLAGLALALGRTLATQSAGQMIADLSTPDLVNCLISVPALSVPVLAAGFWAMRSGAPANPAAAGAVLGLLAAGIAAAIYSLHCPHDPVIYFFTGYGIAIGAVTLAGAALGARFLRW